MAGVPIKLTGPDHILRFRLREPTWAALLERIRRCVGPTHAPEVVYRDDNGDIVVVSSEEEFEECLRVVAPTNEKPLCLTILDSCNALSEISSTCEVIFCDHDGGASPMSTPSSSAYRSSQDVLGISSLAETERVADSPVRPVKDSTGKADETERPRGTMEELGSETNPTRHAPTSIVFNVNAGAVNVTFNAPRPQTDQSPINATQVTATDLHTAVNGDSELPRQPRHEALHPSMHGVWKYTAGDERKEISATGITCVWVGRDPTTHSYEYVSDCSFRARHFYGDSLFVLGSDNILYEANFGEEHPGFYKFVKASE
jgi:hypothetical protein